MRYLLVTCLVLVAAAFAVERLVFGETFTNYT